MNFKAAIASDQAKGFKDSLPGTDPTEIMGMYTPAMLPVMSGLAKGFAVCDHWFSSAPTRLDATPGTHASTAWRTRSTNREETSEDNQARGQEKSQEMKLQI